MVSNQVSGILLTTVKHLTLLYYDWSQCSNFGCFSEVSKIMLTWFDTIFMLVSEALFYRWYFNCELWEKFLKAQRDKVVFTFYHKWWSAIGSIDSFYRKRLCLKTWFWRYHCWFSDFASAKARKVQFWGGYWSSICQIHFFAILSFVFGLNLHTYNIGYIISKHTSKSKTTVLVLFCYWT